MGCLFFDRDKYNWFWKPEVILGLILSLANILLLVMPPDMPGFVSNNMRDFFSGSWYISTW
jgi:hypothetical protein